MTVLYWADDNNSTIWKWDGTTATSHLVDPWENIGDLIVAHDGGLIVSKYSTTGEFAFHLAPDMTTRTDWPAAISDGQTLKHHYNFGLGVYDAAAGVYWLSLAHDYFTRTVAPFNPVWGKFDTAGNLLSVHADDNDFVGSSLDTFGCNAVIQGSWLYWSADTGRSLHRFNVDTGSMWQWCWNYPEGLGESGQKRWLLDVADGQVIQHWYEPGAGQDFFEVYTLGDLPWVMHTDPAGVGLPAPDVQWLADEDDGAPASDSRTGWARHKDGVIYYASNYGGESTESIHQIDLATGAISQVVEYGDGTADIAIGMVVVDGVVEVGRRYLRPLRQHPRTDGRGTSSARRMWPPPRSIQGSLRQGPGSHL